MPQLILDRFTQRIPIYPPLYPGLLYFEALPADQVAEALSERISLLDGMILTLENHLAYTGDFGVPMNWLVRHAIALNKAELGWCREFRASLDQTAND